MRNVRALGKTVSGLSEFVEQANQTFEAITKSIEDIEKVITELVGRVEKLEQLNTSAKAPTTKKRYED